MAVNKNTGDLVWINHVDEHPSAIITQSAIVHGGLVYVGVSSYEEAHAAFIPGYECCTFRGSIMALKVNTGSANSNYKPWDLDGVITNSGIWSALDPATGEILWQTANPTPYANAGGAVTVANDVVYACSQDADGHMYAMEAATGSILWDYASGGSCNSGAAVVKGTVYWGSGYAGFNPSNTGNDQFYAFDVPK